MYGAPLYWRSVLTLAAVPSMRGIVVVFPAQDCETHAADLERLVRQVVPGVPVRAVPGGVRRQDSARHGLAALPTDCDQVLVHDSARPFFSASLVHALRAALTENVQGVVPGCVLTDTIKEIEADTVLRTLDRSRLTAVQTPQLFATSVLRAAHERALSENWEVTDDASMLELADYAVQVVPGEMTNIKITTAEDLRMLEPAPAPLWPCTGFGYDVHAYGGDRPMVLGGIPIAGAPKVQAHSDGDVLLHALCDALLGCLGCGDIGERFPDSDPRFANISSGILVSEVLELARQHALTITHVDLTVIAQVPRLGPHKAAIRSNVARLLELADHQVGFKATTEEHLGFTGRKEGIKAMAVVSALRTHA
ncbi:2-C-methyl-D-erythritol 4-phosphate cytidylyltransferase [Desulfovibrionales bacterium]